MNMRTLPLRRWGFGLVALIAAALPVHAIERGPAPRPSSAASAAPVETQARVIVKYKADSTLMHALSASSAGGVGVAARPLQAQAMGRRLGLSLTDGHATGPLSQVVTATGIASADLAARLAAQGDVEYAVVDRRVHILTVPNDPLLPAGQTSTPATGQWYLRTAGVDGEVASINAEAAWSITTGSSKVVVAVVDTGITAHPDLVGKVLPGYDFISNAATANDGDGADADPSDPGDGITAAETNDTTGQFYHCGALDSNGQATLADPDSWHGTQTAGLIGAATNNNGGMASVGWNVMILPVRALGKCGGVSSDVQTAIRWAAGIAVPGFPVNPNPAKVINLSLGGKSGDACSSDYQGAVSDAIAAGAVVVAAAGNDGLALGSPANCTGVIAVAGVRHAGTKVGYSDLGTNVTIAAPAGNCVNSTGTCLFSLITTSNDGSFALGNPIYTDGDTHASLGTSFSAPLVAGTVALMLSANPSMTPSAVVTALQSTTRPFTASGAAPLVGASSSAVAGGTAVNLTGTPVAACLAPSSNAQSNECYCSTATCGAGLLDAGAAVAVASGLPSSGSSSVAAPSATIVSYQWAIASTTGSATAVFTGSTTEANAGVVTGGVGSFTASLTTTDSLGQIRAATTTVAVTAASSTTPTPPTTPTTPTTTGSSVSSGSSGGGGGVSFGWLCGLFGAVLALLIVRPSRSPP